MLAYRELCDEPTALRGGVNSLQLLNPWSQLMGHNGGVLAVDVVIDSIMDVDVLTLRVVGAWGEGRWRVGARVKRVSLVW